MAKRPKFEKLGVNERFSEQQEQNEKPKKEKLKKDKKTKKNDIIPPKTDEAKEDDKSSESTQESSVIQENSEKQDKQKLSEKLSDSLSSLLPKENKKVDFSKFTFKKIIKTTFTAKDEEKKLTPPSSAPFVLFLVMICMHLIFSAILRSDAFSGKPFAEKSILTIASAACIYIAPLTAYIVSSAKRRHRYYFKAFSPKLLPLSAVCLVLVILQSALQKYYIAYTFSYRVPTGIPQGNTALALFTIALLPAICEEAVIRGVLQHEFTKYGGGLTGIVAGALAFAVIHFDLQYFLIYLVSGLILGVLTHITGSVFPAMIVHFTNNAMTVLLSDRLTFVARERVGGTFLMIMLSALCFLLTMIFLQMTEQICHKKAEIIHRADAAVKKAQEALAEESQSQNEANDASKKSVVSPSKLKRAKADLAYFEKNMETSSLFALEKDTGKRFLSVVFSPLMLACYIIFAVVTVFF